MEKLYSTKEISILLGVTTERVRRWVRDDKLKAIKDCAKGGFKVKESDFEDFLRKNPKYRRVAVSGEACKDLAEANLNQRIFDIEELISNLRYELDELKNIRDLLRSTKGA